jgi:hypothetical protein
MNNIFSSIHFVLSGIVLSDALINNEQHQIGLSICMFVIGILEAID